MCLTDSRELVRNSTTIREINRSLTKVFVAQSLKDS